MRAAVFINGPDDGHKEAEEKLKNVLSRLGIDEYNYVITNVSWAIKKVISEDDVGVVFTYGTKPKVQEIATKHNKIVIEYQKDSDEFVAVRTRKEGGPLTSWRVEEYALIKC